MNGQLTDGRRLAIALVSGIALVATAHVHAQLPEHQHTRAYVDPATGLSLDELVALALKQSPAAAAARDRIAAAKGEADQASRRPVPSLAFEQREQAGGQDRQTSIGLNWPLDLFRRSGRTTLATSGVDAATYAALDRDRRLSIEVRTLAVRLLAAVHHLEVREDLVVANRKIADLTAERVASGIAPAVERDAARIEASMSEVEVRRETATVEDAAAALRAAIGLDAGVPLTLKQTLADVLPAVDIPAALRERLAERAPAAVDARPDLREADAAIARETARTDLASRDGKTDVSLAAGYMRTASGFPQLGLTPALTPTPIEGTFHMITFGATVSLPWSNHNQGAVAAATASLDAARHERDARRLTAQNEIAALVERERNARSALDLFGSGLRDLAARNLDVLRESYQLGRASLLDVLAETRRYLDVEMAYADAQLELALARIALAGAVGDVK